MSGRKPVRDVFVAHTRPSVAGADTHARTHSFAILVAFDPFPPTAAGMGRAIAWAARRNGGDLVTLWVIEGVATYDARLEPPVSLRLGWSGADWQG